MRTLTRTYTKHIHIPHPHKPIQKQGANINKLYNNNIHTDDYVCMHMYIFFNIS